MHRLTETEKQQILDMFHDTEDPVLTALVWGIDPSQVISIAFFAGQPDRKPPAPARRSVRDVLSKVVMMPRRAA